MDFRLPPVTAPLTNRSAGMARATPTAQESGGFSSVLSGALKGVSEAQNQSSALQQQVQLENPNVSLEETMVAIQKAQIGFQATLHVRNRMVQAYTDIMNMQV